MKFNGDILAQQYSFQVYYTGILSFEKGFIFQIFLSSIDLTSHEWDLHWFFVKEGSEEKDWTTFVTADHDSSFLCLFSSGIAKIVPSGIKIGKN